MRNQILSQKLFCLENNTFINFMIKFINRQDQHLVDPVTCTNLHPLKSNFWNCFIFVTFFHWLSCLVFMLVSHRVDFLGWGLLCEEAPCPFCAPRTLAFPCSFWGHIEPYSILLHPSFDSICQHVFHCRPCRDHNRTVDLQLPPRCLLIFHISIYYFVLRVTLKLIFLILAAQSKPAISACS